MTYTDEKSTLGLAGDGITDDSLAFQTLLNQQGEIRIPYGIYKIGRTLKIRSHTKLLVHPQARIIFADHAGRTSEDFLLTNADYQDGDENIWIEGGIWDGNCGNNQRGPDAPNSYTGVLMNFFHIRNFQLKNVTLTNPVSYYTRFCKMQNFLIENIKFRTTILRPNQDGIHLGGACENGIIRYIDGRGIQVPNDDVVALNADDANQRAQNLGKINGPIRNMVISHLYAEYCHTFVRLLSCWSPIEDIHIDQVEGGCEVCAINMDAARNCAVKVFSPDDPQFQNGVGHIQHVYASHFKVWKVSNRASNPLIDAMTRVKNFQISNFYRDYVYDAAPHTPTLKVQFLPSTRIKISGLKLPQLKNIRYSPTMIIHTQENRSCPLDLEYQIETCIQLNEEFSLPLGGFAYLSLHEETS